MDKDDKRKAGFPSLLGRQKAKDLSPDPLEATPKSNGNGESSPESADDFVAQTIKSSNQAAKEKKEEVLPAASSTTNMRDHNNDETDDHEITNHVSTDLTEDDKREIYDAIDLIRRKLSFAKDFTEEERQGMMRLGKSGRTFVEKAQNLVEHSPGILPRSFDLDEFNRDADLYQELGNISDELQKLTERVADTEAAVGSDAFTASLVVYQSGKMARTGDDMDSDLAGWRRKISDSAFD